MNSLINHPFVTKIYNFIISHPILWFVLLIIILILFIANWLASFIPQIDVIKSKILLPIAKIYKHKRLVKKAIKSDVCGHVNLEISKLKSYLPSGWVPKMDVEWVNNENEGDLLNDGRIVVRVRPVESQDQNFVNTVYHYFRTSFFPKTHAVIPKPHFEASVLYICMKIAENRGYKTKEIFEDQILEPAILRHDLIPSHLDDYRLIDSRGFFTGTFLRELHLTAVDSRFTSARRNMGQEASCIVKHIKDFIEAFQNEEMTPETWYNDGSASKYAILLVAHPANPAKTQSGIDAYIRRARSSFESGAKRLYVFGSNTEAKFANSVIAGIEGTIDGVKLVEKYETPFDYRGQELGIGAIFSVC